MIPNTLILRNFMCYRDAEGPQELSLDGIAIACLSGDNGAGKSALLDAITWALWGRARMSDDELVALGASEMEVELRFALDRQEYKVLRKYQRGGGKRAGKGALELQIRNGVGWKSLSELQKNQTQASIDALLRMRYETFINSAFLLQGRADEFTRKPAGERKQVLADILDLDEYAHLEDKAKERAKALADKAKVLDARIVDLGVEADKLPFYLGERDKAAKRAAELSDARERDDKALRGAEARVRELGEKRAARDERATHLAQLLSEQEAQRQRIAELGAAIAAAEATLARAGEIAAGVAALRAARDALQQLDGLRGGYEALMERRRELQEQMKDAKRALEAELAGARHELATLEKQRAQRDSAQRDIADAQQKLAVLEPLAAERARLEDERAALEERSERHGKLQLRRRELVAHIEKRQASLVGSREETQRLLKRLDKQLHDQPRWLADLAGAREQERLLFGDEERLAALRATEQRAADQAVDLRAQCQSIKAQADDMKKRQALLVPGSGACPVCGSELGEHGAEQVRAHYDDDLQRLRADFAARRRAADAADAALKDARDQLAALAAQADGRRVPIAAIPALEQQLAQAKGWQAERAAAQADLDSLVAQIDTKQFDPEAQFELRALDAELAELGADGDALKRQRKALANQLAALQKQLDEGGRIGGALGAQRQALAELDAALAALPQALARAAQLEGDLASNNYALDVRAAGRQVEAELRELGYAPAAHDAARQSARELAPWDDEDRQLAIARDKIDLQRRAHAAEESAAQRTAELMAARQREIAELDAALIALRGADGERQSAQRQLDDTQRALNVANNVLGEREADLRRAEDAKADLKQREGERREMQEQHALFAELREAYGKKGIQAMLIETAIPEIEREANALLAGMTDNQMHVAMKTQSLTKSGTVSETLEIEVGDSLGTRVYDAFSGGEAFRVNFAIRIALSKLLARRAGARLETLVIDEGFGALDAQGRERMVEAITSVQHDFKRILVITHLQELKDLFPTQIEVVKTPQGSVWSVV